MCLYVRVYCVRVCVQELDSLKRSQKQQSSSQSATEVRLNQAREDVQKYKSLLQKAQADAKVVFVIIAVFCCHFNFYIITTCGLLQVYDRCCQSSAAPLCNLPSAHRATTPLHQVRSSGVFCCRHDSLELTARPSP